MTARPGLNPWRWLATVLVLSLIACTPALKRTPADAGMLAAQAAREQALAGQDQWSLSGRIAVASEQGGGNGRIDWSQDGEDFVVELSAPMSRQSWRLSRVEGWVRLEGLEDGPWQGTDAQTLLWQATGWLIPIDALAAWVRGIRADSPAQVVFAPDGLPAELTQAGWTVSYRDWDRRREPALPARVFANRGADRVRLQIDDWRLQPIARPEP